MTASPPVLCVSAPGRICLFGEHQDYLRLPVVAAAVDLRLFVEAEPHDEPGFLVRMDDLGVVCRVDPSSPQTYAYDRDYIRSAANVLRRQGARWSHGWKVSIRSDIPINAGVSSSSAFTVAWLRVLLETADRPPSADDEQLARWAFQAEVAEFGEPGGMMDHFCAAMGGLLRIDTRPPFGAERIPIRLDGFVLGHSLEPKATLETLAQTRRDVSDGIVRMIQVMPHFDLAETPLAEVEGLFKYLQPVPARRLRANLVNRNISVEARRAIEEHDRVKIGHLLTLHHAQLRDGLDLSTEKIERMIAASLGAGALGAKINGSGGGGTMFAYAPGRQLEVADAIRREGGVPYVLSISDGVRIDPRGIPCPTR